MRTRPLLQHLQGDMPGTHSKGRCLRRVPTQQELPRGALLQTGRPGRPGRPEREVPGKVCPVYKGPVRSWLARLDVPTWRAGGPVRARQVQLLPAPLVRPVRSGPCGMPAFGDGRRLR